MSSALAPAARSRQPAPWRRTSPPPRIPPYPNGPTTRTPGPLTMPTPRSTAQGQRAAGVSRLVAPARLSMAKDDLYLLRAAFSSALGILLLKWANKSQSSSS